MVKSIMIMADLKSKSPLAPRIKYSDASVAAEVYDRERKIGLLRA